MQRYDKTPKIQHRQHTSLDYFFENKVTFHFCFFKN